MGDGLSTLNNGEEMKKLALLAVFMFVVIGCKPTPIAPPSFVGASTGIVKIAEIPEHGCDVYLISGTGIYNHTITVCPKLSADTSTGAMAGSGKHQSPVSGSVVEHR